MPVSPLLLQNINVLCPLSREEIEAISNAMSLHEYSRREVVFGKGDLGRGLFFLLEGRLQSIDFTVDGREVGLYFVASGDFFGELAVVDSKPHAEFMIAVTKARVALLPTAAVHSLLLNIPSVAEHLLLRLASRLRAVSTQRTVLFLPNPAQRICAQLAQMSVNLPEGGATISHAPTHQEIAIMVNTSRETVTRVFQVLQANGILHRQGDTLAVAALDYLEAVAQGKIDPPKAS